MLKVDGIDLLLFLIVVFYVVVCPYTKVEESFNMQALHDITQFGTNLNYYDHLEFPGVVPRTFLGSLLIAGLSYPANILFEHFDVPVLYNQVLCRSVLGLVSCLSVAHFRDGVTAKFGARASQLTGILLACQFHICFYMSRTLPNVFALILCLNAFGFWLKVRFCCAIPALIDLSSIFPIICCMVNTTTGQAYVEHRAAHHRHGDFPVRHFGAAGAVHAAAVAVQRGMSVVYCLFA